MDGAHCRAPLSFFFGVVLFLTPRLVFPKLGFSGFRLITVFRSSTEILLVLAYSQEVGSFFSAGELSTCAKTPPLFIPPPGISVSPIVWLVLICSPGDHPPPLTHPRLPQACARL